MSLPHAILGLLTYKPMSGYDLKSFFDKSIKYFWPAQLSQIYRDLGTLEKKEWVTSHIEPQEGRPDRKVYSITEEGKKELLNWLNKMPQSFTSIVRDETALRMFLGSRIEIDEMIFQMKAFVKEKKETVMALDAIADMIQKSDFDKEKVYWLLSLRKGYRIAEAELKWAEECIEELERYKKILKEKEQDES
ncbi:transcriptional regulator [Collibacillus ludicampi]|jgi:PadR family transcriptional regulator AphA|uniref:Transcriptional regulator n=1 Tax=Collibacillus ludicampi TaxID=2771369 RepID=A0AAV4LEL9_9BACL|nr:PadR family transcriptional regulator [Collibacillus ludicampi]GIM46274.1 transcriptional regulator [Collibacillus ludicampi]